MTSSAWLAVGIALASLLGAGLRPDALVLLASALGVAAGGVHLRARGRTSRGSLRAVAPVAIGALAIALRLAVGGLSAAPSTASLPEGRGPWVAEVAAVSAPHDGAQPATLRIDTGGSGNPARSASAPDVLVAATLPRFPEVEPGDLVRVDGALEAPPDGPYGDYLRRTGVSATLFSRTLATTGHDPGAAAILERARRTAGDALAAAIPEPEAGLAAGIVIGLRDRVDRDLAADFTTVGASHIVAISGWNIAIVAATIAAITGRLSRRRRAVVLVVAIVAYVLFAGASPSVVRAAAMAGVVLLARETGRAGRATAALGWAAALLLLADPALISDAGFQLSTLATGGILAWANPWTERLSRIAGGRVPGWLAESLGVSLAAQLATLPIVLLTFGRLAIISPVVNLVVVPLVAPAMAAALIGLLGGLVPLAGGPAALATVLGLPAWALLTTMCTVIRAAARLPFANVTLPPPWTAVAAASAAAAILLGPPAWRLVRRHRSGRPNLRSAGPIPRRASPPIAGVAAAPGPSSAAARKRGGGTRGNRRSSRSQRASLVALAVATAALGLAFAHRADGTSRITVLDVGQGDSILVEGGRGGRMLVDGGPDPNRLIVELDRRLPPWDRRIDILILTHPHEDHVAGLPLILERYRVGRIYETGMRGPGPGYAAFDRFLAGPTAPPRSILATGARISVDDIRMSVLWPDPGRVPREPPDAGRGINDVSVVLLGQVAGRRFLLTGDVEDDVDPILASRGLPPVDILKVAHHGSATASTPTFLDAARPAVAIVSAGLGNPYGHPAPSTIERLRGTGARVLRTDTDGSVSVGIAADGAISVGTTGPRRAALLPSGALAEIDLARTTLGAIAATDGAAARGAAAPLATPASDAVTMDARAAARAGSPPALVPSLVAAAAARRLAFSCGIPSIR
jgi:competence protein ComEC